MYMRLWKRAKKYAKKCFAPVTAAGAAVTLAASNASAAIADIWTAVDVTTFDTNLTTILVAFIGIALMFAAYAYVKRVLPGRG